MRRLALPTFACGIVLLTACGGGSGFSGSTASDAPQVVVLSAGTNGQAQDFEIAPGGTAPLAVAATAYTGTGITPNVVVDATFTWAARYVNPLTDPPSVATYTVGSAPNAFKTCPPIPKTLPPVPILQQFGTGAAATGYPGYTLMPATATANQVFLGAVPGVPAPYCLEIVATAVKNGTVGAHTVIVSQSP